MDKFIQLLISGIAVGSIYGIVALGFVLMYKSTEVFNFAQGDLMMLGAYIAFALTATHGLPFWLAAPLVLVIGFLIGRLINVTLVRPMLGQPFFSIVMVFIGLSFVVRSVVLMVWGPLEKRFPDVLPERVYNVSGIIISSLDLIIIGLAAAALLLFGLFFSFSKLGLQMRATADNFEAAVTSGISAQRVFGTAIGLGTMLAFVGGTFIANLGLVNISLGEIGLLAFPAIVIGGVQSIPGAVVGGVLVGVIEKMAQGYVGEESKFVFVYAVLLLVLMIRPYGLFGERDILRV